jgi:hypothetical protein
MLFLVGVINVFFTLNRFLLKSLNAYIFESPCGVFPFSNTIVIMEHHWLSILKGKRKVFKGYW